jgi:thymidylate synthase
MQTLNNAWWEQLAFVMAGGRQTSPRGQLTLEVPSRTLSFDMNYPVVVQPLRKLGYKFMAAEAWWILSGRDDVDAIAPYSKDISKFSDDGHKFYGAYGPRIVAQLDYVVNALLSDPDTRQSVLTTWRQNPTRSKDVPCTVAFSWMIRDGALECHVFMRSSDNWLGIPYDAFNFSMLSAEIARQLNQHPLLHGVPIKLGDCHLTAASSHIYQRNFDDVLAVLNTAPVRNNGVPVPVSLYNPEEMMPSYGRWTSVAAFLDILKDTKAGHELRWWEQ